MTRYTVNNWNSYLSIPLYVTALTVTDSSCNEDTITVVDLSSFKFLRSVVIGNECFKYVRILSIVGLNWLESVNIGYYTFVYPGMQSLLEGSSFKIVNCPRLKSLYIRGNSCYRYNWFELAQLPQLKSIVMGFYDYGCFVRTRNAVFRGKSDRTDEL